MEVLKWVKFKRGSALGKAFKLFLLFSTKKKHLLTSTSILIIVSVMFMIIDLRKLKLYVRKVSNPIIRMTFRRVNKEKKNFNFIISYEIK